MKDKIKKKINLLITQDNRCCYCNCKFKNNKRNSPTLEHVIPKCLVGDNTKFKLSCKKCNLLKGDISEELFLQGYICVNIKPGYDEQSYNKAMKVRGPLRWYHKFINRNKKHYNITIKEYE